MPKWSSKILTERLLWRRDDTNTFEEVWVDKSLWMLREKWSYLKVYKSEEAGKDSMESTGQSSEGRETYES